MQTFFPVMMAVLLALWTRDTTRDFAKQRRINRIKYKWEAAEHNRLMCEAHDRGDMRTAKMHADYHGYYEKCASSVFGSVFVKK